MSSRQVDKKTTIQVRIDRGLHYLLRIKAAKESTTIRELVEQALGELLTVESGKEESS